MWLRCRDISTSPFRPPDRSEIGESITLLNRLLKINRFFDAGFFIPADTGSSKGGRRSFPFEGVIFLSPLKI
jgi:hypothetical protein